MLRGREPEAGWLREARHGARQEEGEGDEGAAIDALGTFIANRFRQELTIAYLDRMRTWLDVSLAVLAKDATLAEPANAGRMAAMRYFFRYELPRIGAWLKVVRERDMTCAEMSEEAF